MKGFKLLLTGLIIAILFSSCLKEKLELDKYQEDLGDHLFRYETIEIDYNKLLASLKSHGESSFTINLEIPSKPDWQFTMSKQDVSEMFPADSKVYILGEGDVVTEVMDVPEFNAYEGRLLETINPSAFTFTTNIFEAEIQEESGEIFRIQPMRGMDVNAPENLYVIYSEKDVVIDKKHKSCGTNDVVNSSLGDRPYEDNNLNSRVNCRVVEVTQMSDFTNYKNKFNWNKNWNSGWMSTRLYYGGRRYWNVNGFRLNFIQSALYVSTWDNPELNAWAAIPLWNNWRNFHGKGWFQKNDINTLWTGKPASVLGKAGLARINTICTHNWLAYNFCVNGGTNYFMDNLLAHEFGHTLGAFHDNSLNGIMTAYPGSTKLSQVSMNQINNKLSNGGQNCMTWRVCK